MQARNVWRLLAGIALATIGLARSVAADKATAIAPAAAQAPAPVPSLGIDADLHDKAVFPANNPWNVDISRSPVDANSSKILASIGLHTGLHPDFGTVYNGAPNGIPYVVVGKGQPLVPVEYTAYGDESDKGPFPIPANAPVEGGLSSNGDRHVIVIDRDAWVLYELFGAVPISGGKSWQAQSGAKFDLTKGTTRPAGWTSADAAGLPIFPGLVRYDEVVGMKKIDHALRFTVAHSRRAYVPPARHAASSSHSTNLPPMGMRVRLKANVNLSHFPASAQVILTALKTYGMIVADNGSNWYLSGAPDPRWSDDELHSLGHVHGSDFEVIRMDGVVNVN